MGFPQHNLIANIILSEISPINGKTERSVTCNLKIQKYTNTSLNYFVTMHLCLNGKSHFHCQLSYKTQRVSVTVIDKKTKLLLVAKKYFVFTAQTLILKWIQKMYVLK